MLVSAAPIPIPTPAAAAEAEGEGEGKMEDRHRTAGHDHESDSDSLIVAELACLGHCGWARLQGGFSERACVRALACVYWGVVVG